MGEKLRFRLTRIVRLGIDKRATNGATERRRRRAGIERMPAMSSRGK
jgi:hypothetical protein